MADAAQYFSTDLGLGATGDLQVADGVLESQQRILRRLLTNPTQYDANGNVSVVGDYIFEPNYGAGLPRYVGKKLDLDAITALIKSQMYLEESVQQQPEPQITVTPILNGIFVQIRYIEADSSKPASLSFDVTE